MKKLLFTFMIILIANLSQAQVGIGTTTPNIDSALDITSNDSGLLLPRIALTATTNPAPLSVHVAGMTIYNTATTGDVTPGMYYNNGTIWVPILGVTSNDWTLLGNTGTVNGINFVGTTDNQALDIRTNNVIHHRFTTTGQLETLNAARSVLIGENAGDNQDNSANRNNVFIGNNSGLVSTTGVSNTAVGYNTLDSAINVDFNVAIGAFSLGNLVSGDYNVAIGTALGSITDATNNVAIGLNAMSNSTDGDNNIAIGRAAGANSDANDNVYIGYNADAFNAATGSGRNVIIGSEAGESAITGTAGGSSYVGRVMLGYGAGGDSGTNNTLFIENSPSPTPLLYGEFDNDILRVGGQLQIGSSDDATAAAIYSFPIVDGTSGQALVTDGSGNVTWSTVSGGGADTQDLSIDNTVGDLTLVDGGTVEIKAIADSDDDTLIQVEEGADDDTIRFDLAGTEKLRITTKGQFEVVNTGGSILVGEGTGTSDDLVNRRNVLIGESIAPNVSTGSSATWDSAYNVGIGYNSLTGLTTGASNIAIGRDVLNKVTTQSNNIAIGRLALNDIVGSSNVSIGTFSGYKRTGGSNNLFLGYNAVGFRAGSGNSNTAIGAGSLSALETATFNTAIGADVANRLTTGSYNTFIGKSAGPSTTYSTVDFDTTGAVVIGHAAGSTNSYSNLFLVHNNNSTTPLLSGVFANNSAFAGGGVLDKGPYNDNRLGVNIDMSSNAAALTHTLTVGGSVGIDQLINLNPGTAPATPAVGDVYFDSVADKLRVYTSGSGWVDLH